MIILVDGIDRVGKTTLCKRLSEVLGIPVFKDDSRYCLAVNGNRVINTEKNNTMVNLLEQGIIKDAIFDRFHLTEYAYGLADRGYINYDMVDMDERLSKIDNLVLVLVSPTDIQKSSQEHGKNLANCERLMREFYNSSLIKYKFNVDYNNIDAFADFLKHNMLFV